MTHIAFPPFLRFPPVLGVVRAVLGDFSEVTAPSASDASESSESLRGQELKAKQDGNNQWTYLGSLKPSPLMSESARPSRPTSRFMREGNNLDVLCCTLYNADGIVQNIVNTKENTIMHLQVGWRNADGFIGSSLSRQRSARNQPIMRLVRTKSH